MERENYLKSLGFRMIRFTEFEVTNSLDNTLQTIFNFMNDTSS